MSHCTQTVPCPGEGLTKLCLSPVPQLCCWQSSPNIWCPFQWLGWMGALHGLCELEDKFKMICLLTCRRLWQDRGLQLNLSLLLICLQPVQLGWEPVAANRPCCEPLFAFHVLFLWAKVEEGARVKVFNSTLQSLRFASIAQE